MRMFTINADGGARKLFHVAEFFDDDRGATAIEYALIASLIAVAIVGALTALGTGLSSEFSEVSGYLK
jgi:pilus assembly protein Flp/PilA